MNSELLAILSQFGLTALERAGSIQPLQNRQGFSGARLWRVCTAGQMLSSPEGRGHDWCLRSWPTSHPSVQRLIWMHACLERAAEHLSFITLPLAVVIPEANLGQASGIDFLGAEVNLLAPNVNPLRFAQVDGVLWQVEPWAKGSNDFLADPNLRRLESVMTGLAALHEVWRQSPEVVSGSGFIEPVVFCGSPLGPSPGILKRLEELKTWHKLVPSLLLNVTSGVKQTLGDSDAGQVWLDLAREVLGYWNEHAASIQRQLQQASGMSVALGPVLADVWSDHLFFEGDRLVQIIDYGAMRHDCVAADLSRSVGSLLGDDLEKRSAALGSYQSIRELSREELVLLDAFDRSTRLCGPMNWLKWLFVEHRLSPTNDIFVRVCRLVRGEAY